MCLISRERQAVTDPCHCFCWYRLWRLPWKYSQRTNVALFWAYTRPALLLSGLTPICRLGYDITATGGTRDIPTFYNTNTFLCLGDCTKCGKTLVILWLQTVQRKRTWVFGLSRTIAIFSTSEAEACCVLSLGALETKGWRCSVPRAWDPPHLETLQERSQ